jgi:UDP-N-acetylglucosamine 2-epimerase
VDDIKNKPLMAWKDLAERWPEPFSAETATHPDWAHAVVAVHPVTNDPEETARILRITGNFIRGFDRVYLSYPNTDPGRDAIVQNFDQLAWGCRDRCTMLPPNLGAHAFRSLMKLCGTIIGNSSALITEAPHLGCLPILVGTRQEGRFPSESDGNACGRILDHLYAAVTERGGSIRTKA